MVAPMKTVRIPLTVLALDDEADLLDEPTATLAVVVASDASALLVREQVHQAMGGSSFAMSSV
jgi:hypothetical protein